MSIDIPKLRSGTGRIVVSSHGSRATFSELSSTYPLKLLSPRAFDDSVALVYLLTYGGGLVSGDQVNLVVQVASSAKLVLLSQGSTKVFKTRPGRRLATVEGDQLSTLPPTTQNLTFTVSASGGLFLLPDPVTCFRSATYNQIQTFHLAETSSAAILDWITSGRRSLGEEWAFSRYYSVNEIFLDGKRIARDVMLLEDNELNLAPYSCYAMLFLLGPMLQPTIQHLTAQYERISVMKARTPDDLIWSLSPVVGQGRSAIAVVVRLAGKETESVKRWIRDALSPAEDVLGADAFKQAFH
ncbi:UreD-domain-containing protein [Hymenopellis radicata]|nr:UreD-domain-containing protein [Hymenopellis radicata]